jgi:predicted RNA binding protein YcfA (HicA-like mRNA interferase family)
VARTYPCENRGVKSAELLRKLSKCAKQTGATYTSEPGKGSHLKVRLGDRKTIVPEHNKELGKGLFNQILKDLGIEEKDLP